MKCTYKLLIIEDNKYTQGTKSYTLLSKEYYGLGCLMICDIKHKEVELREYNHNMKEMDNSTILDYQIY